MSFGVHGGTTSREAEEIASRILQAKQQEEAMRQRELELLKDLVRFQLGLSTRFPIIPKSLLPEEETALAGGRAPKLTVVQLPYFLATNPINRPILLYGPPGVGKTTGIREYFNMLAEILGRKPIYMVGHSPEELENLIARVRENPERYLVFSYLKGWDITRNTYAIPELSKMKQVWIIPPKVEVLTVTEDMINKFLQENPEIEGSTLYDILMGEEPLYASPVIPRLMRYFPMGVLVIDEALQAFPEFVRQYLMGLAGERHWAENYLSPLTMLVLISNPPEYNEAVQQPPLPLGRRVILAEVVEPTVEDVWNYIVRTFRKVHGVEPHPLLYSLLKTCGDLLLRPPREVEWITPYPTPAGWTQFVKMVNPIFHSLTQQGIYTIPEEIRKRITASAVSILGSEAANRVALALSLATPPPEAILEKPELFMEFLERLRSEGQPVPVMRFAREKMLLDMLAYCLSVPPEMQNALTERMYRLGQTVAKLLEMGAITDEDLLSLLYNIASLASRRYQGNQMMVYLAVSSFARGFVDYAKMRGNQDLIHLLDLVILEGLKGIGRGLR